MLSALDSLARRAVRAVREEDGVTAIEYALLASLILIVCVLAFQATGTALFDIYERWSAAVLAALS